MKKLLGKFFKKDANLSYILPEYRPAASELASTQLGNMDYYVDKSELGLAQDEMHIDNIYRNA